MNTKTMRLPPRRVLTPDKSKDQDGVPTSGKPSEIAATKSPPITPPVASDPRKAQASATVASATTELAGSNQLLAGYLAHEFFTKGIIFGEVWDPARAQAVAVSDQPAEPRKTKASHRAESMERSKSKRQRYVEVANLFRADGTHMPGIVNPCQLAQFLDL